MTMTMTMTMMQTGAQRRSDLPRGTRRRARAQSTQHWWKIKPRLHLIIMIKIIMIIFKITKKIVKIIIITVMMTS